MNARSALAVAVLLCSSRLLAGSVTATSDDAAIRISNGLVDLTVDRASGQVKSLKSTQGKPIELLDAKGTWYWDANAEVAEPPAGQSPPKKGYFRPPAKAGLATLVTNSPEQADVAVKASPTTFFGFEAEFHYVVRANVPGVYAYVVVRHPETAPVATLWQTRFVLRTALDGTFTHWAKSEDQIIAKPTGKVVSKVMDATFKLDDGTVKTKYQNSVYWADAKQYGVIGQDGDGNGVGVWVLSASTEYHNGGPIKQGQTVHDDVLLRVLQSVHFGAKPVTVEKGEPWQKAYGPFLVYVNRGGDAKSLWADAAKRQTEEAAAWPYAWVKTSEYTHDRGGVLGQVRFADGTPAANARVILSAPNEDWAFAAKGYQFYGKTDAAGRFSLGKVVPGKYTLFASGADQPNDFQQADITIVAGEAKDLGHLTWTPVSHGKTLWQIGTFDRSAGEFRNGDGARDYQMFTRYPQQFPNDVNYTVGKSDPRQDWNYAQWSYYAKTPAWAVNFDAPPATAGQATLTIGVASAQPAHGKLTDVRVAINGREIGAIRLPKTGTAGYRGGVQDSPYNVITLPFDASLLKASGNTLTLQHADAEAYKAPVDKPQNENEDAPPGVGNPGQVMYDAIRLELPAK